MRKFLVDESGAVTVDWVVLTGGIVMLGLAAQTVINGGVSDASADTAAVLSGIQIQTTFPTPTP
ncbi:hypothetical protein HKCCE2091_14240 [Rhodobacterales bacterium HKCCE2091]|nr:hypothetical protein [Rhodobacterales bacterium HKCCE2091]